jgi:hypothetical protein
MRTTEARVEKRQVLGVKREALASVATEEANDLNVARRPLLDRTLEPR